MTEETMTKGTEELNKMVANATANQEEKERFSIENDDQLKWAFQMMEEKRKEIRAKKDMIQQATDYYEGQIKDLRQDIDYFKGLAMQYAEEQADEDPNWSFKESPYGRITRTKESSKLAVTDKEALIKHYKGTSFVEEVVQDKLKWADLKKNLSSPDGQHVTNEDGELINGVEVVTKPSALVMKHKSVKGSWVEKED
ncbi:host-nuclease inhibitor Gam family protein [Limosilactobacillus reuteri]|uniref:host-nuclease inhibitor Gam family protein n=1 Tax=Limosilactobacillus reuteri TaxID=1598 RepID=UPI002B05EEF2|nr:host-nuclease inhibitor Gam family protein [Limosilactobacillus reuteri]